MTEGESNRADVVDVDELVISMKRELNYYWSLGERLDGETELCLIYKVPQHIRMIDRIAYEPIVQSIGPYHHGTPALQAMEKEKWNCLDYILKLNPEKTLRDYLMVMWELENQAKSCYLEEIKMENKKFLRMLLLDGCFILVSLYGTNGIGVPMPIEYVPTGNPQEDIEESRLGQKRASWENTKNEATRIENKTAQSRHLTENLVLASEQSKPSTSRQSMQHDKPVYEDDFDQVGPWYTNFLAHDLLLLENQIPFFVVKRVYELVAGKDTSILLNNIVKFLEGIIHFYPRSIQESERPKDFYHLLHLCHMYFRPSKKMEEGHHYQARRRYFNYFLQMGCKFLKLGLQSDENVQNSSLNPQSDFLKASQHCWRRAVQYHEAGVEFRRKEFDKNNPHSLLDVRFSNGVMEIPCLIIDDSTGSLFRNLIAFEQTCPQFGNDVTAYVVFMTQLLSMPDDVTLLARRGIIVDQLRSDKGVSTLLTKLSKDIVFSFNYYYYLKPVHQSIEEHYQMRLKRWMAWLWQNHFSNPWLGLAAIAGTFILLCTVVQTIFTLFSYADPPA
ncbi:UPF0481 protein [Ananas comosus]|uniref:UPF0481 protein n=1 Tax=Ananas comosus TaxID=4615 RepID=A0A199UJZ3_ANACO|nr:UPF0481 protein [Ananas comosus]